MARIEHRQSLRGAVRSPSGWRRMPRPGRLFVVLALVVAGIELWPAANAFWLGATEWWTEIPPLLPVAARSAAMVLLPAAVAWGSPRRYRANAWLWKGALIVALVQLARYPVGVIGDSVVRGLADAGVDQSDIRWLAVNIGFGLVLAVLSVLGVWALGEGVKDAGGGSRVTVVIAALVALAVGVLFLAPSVTAGLALDLQVVTGFLSVVVNMAYVFAHGLLAGRSVAGASRRTGPARAWLVGALGAVVLLVTPVLSLSLQLANFYLFGPGEGIFPSQVFVLLSFLGWPVFALALGMGMARVPAAAPSLVGTGFVMRGKARHLPAAA